MTKKTSSILCLYYSLERKELHALRWQDFFVLKDTIPVKVCPTRDGWKLIRVVTEDHNTAMCERLLSDIAPASENDRLFLKEMRLLLDAHNLHEDKAYTSKALEKE